MEGVFSGGSGKPRPQRGASMDEHRQPHIGGPGDAKGSSGQKTGEGEGKPKLIITAGCVRPSVS
jgi:hypothetical protein